MPSRRQRNSKPSSRAGRWPVGAICIAIGALLCAACASSPPITELPSYVRLRFERAELGSIPVILVGQIKGYSEIGGSRPSRWSSDFPVQLARVDVQVDTVLQAYTFAGGIIREGNAPEGRVPIYYFHATRATPTPSMAWMGMSGYGGRWRMGDRVMFFLLRENGHLRAACDQHSDCTINVLSGAHRGYRPQSTDVTTSIIDILLTRGQGATDRQMVKAIDDFHLYSMNAEYAIGALQKLAGQETPVVSKAARQKLDEELSTNCTQPPGCGGNPWDVPCNTYRKTHPNRTPAVEPNGVLPGILHALPPAK